MAGIRNIKRRLRDDGLSPHIPERERPLRLPTDLPKWASNGGPGWCLLNRSSAWMEASTYPKARALSPYPGNPIR